MQIKTTRYSFTPIKLSKIGKISVIKDMEKLELLYIAGGNVKWFNHYEKTVWQFLKKLNTELSHDPEIPFLGIYPKDLKTATQTNPCTICSHQHSSQ